MIPSSVLDTSALQAFLGDEPGAEVVDRALQAGTAISLVNWAQVLTLEVRTGGSVSEFLDRLGAERIVGPHGLLMVEPATPQDAERVATLEPLTRRAGLSLADRFCVATGIRMGLPIFTADRQWSNLAIPGAAIHLIR